MDEHVFGTVNRFAEATPWLHTVIAGYAGYGVVLFAGLLLAGWLVARRDSEPDRLAAVLAAGIATFVAVGLNQPLVAFFGRPRPYTVHPDWLILAHRSADPSFPSDHAVMAGATAIGLWFVSRRLGVIALLAAMAMAGGRVYIGAHYPSDVVAGLLFGAAVAVVTYLLTQRVLIRIVRAGARTRLRPLLVDRQHNSTAHGR